MAKTRGKPTTTQATTYHPVDGGWAWVILLASAVMFMLFIGTMKSFGIYFVALMEYYEAKATTASIISGVLQGVYSIFSLPVVTIGLKYLSCRQSMVISGALGFIAYLAGSFANRIEIVIFTHGVIYGLGFSFMHGPAAYLIGLYFKKRRDLANASIVAAGGLGGLVLPPIYRYLIDTYGLKGALLITSGILMNTLPMAFLLRPPSFYQRRRTTENGIILDEKMKNENEKYILHNSPIVKIKTGEGRTRSISVNIHSNAPQNETRFGSLPHIPNRSMTSIENNALFQSFSSIGSMDAMNSFSQLDLRRNIEKNSKRDVGENVRNDQNVEKVLDLSLLKEPLMVIFMISYCLGSIGSAYGILFAPAFAKDKNIENQKIALLVSIMCGCDFGGRLLSGFIVDRKILKNYQLVSLSQFITGLIMAFCSFYTQFWHFVLFSIVFGLCGGSIFALTPSIIVDFLGLEHFRSAFGLLVLGQGITLGGSSPLIGFLRDKTATYNTSFYFMASLLFVSAFTLLLEPCARKRQKKMLPRTRHDEEEEISLQVDT